jgi:putative FmdB family regulatory protein
MAVYVFVCAHCGWETEKSAPIQEQLEAPVCRTCGKFMRRSYSAPSVRFHGNGWGSKP